MQIGAQFKFMVNGKEQVSKDYQIDNVRKIVQYKISLGFWRISK